MQMTSLEIRQFWTDWLKILEGADMTGSLGRIRDSYRTIALDTSRGAIPHRPLLGALWSCAVKPCMTFRCGPAIQAEPEHSMSSQLVGTTVPFPEGLL